VPIATASRAQSLERRLLLAIITWDGGSVNELA
jgi:hypothetical protein